MGFKVGDGFDHYKQDTDLLSRSGFLQWQVVTPFAPVISFVTAANGVGKAVRIENANGSQLPNSGLRGVFADRNAEFYQGWRLRIPSGSIGNTAKLQIVLYDTIADAPQLTIYFNPGNYAVQVYRGTTSGTLLATSPNNVWTGDVFSFIDVYAKIDGAAGAFDVRVRGVSVFGGTQTSQNTKNTANAWSDALDILPYNAVGAQVAFVDVDDYHYNDTTTDSGTFANNSFMGDIGCDTLFATGDGGTAQWTPDTGMAHFSRVNEQAMDSDTSYNATATPGNEDQLTFQPLTQVIPIIYALQVTVAGRKDDVGPRVLKIGIKSGTTVSYGSNHSLPDLYAYFTEKWVLDPNTGANWTRTAVNNVLGLYNLVS